MNNIYLRLKRKMYLMSLRRKLKNKDFTLLCNNCTAGSIYHQLGLQFKSPTINLSMSYEDFLYFCLNFKDFSKYEIIEKNGKDYPSAELISCNKILHPITIHFMHYKSFEEAKESWTKRMDRINYNNVFVLLDVCNNDDINESIIELFNAVKYRKLLLYNKAKINNNLPLNNFGIDFGNEYHIAKILDDYRMGYYFNQFDFVKWFNGK